MTRSLYHSLLQALQTEAVVLATVIEVSGSTPREIGAKMFVKASGEIQGTIGGGAGEAKVIHQALQVLETGIKQRVEIDLSGNRQVGAQERPKEGICGGKMQVWLERWSGSEARSIVQQIIMALEAGQSITLVTPLAFDRSPWVEIDRGCEAVDYCDGVDPPKSPLLRGTLNHSNPVPPLLRAARGDQISSMDGGDRGCEAVDYCDGVDPPKSPLLRGTLNHSNPVPPLLRAARGDQISSMDGGDRGCEAVDYCDGVDPPKSPLLRGTLNHSNPVPPLLRGTRGDQIAEVLQPLPTVLIIGAGHCGIQLAKIADMAGFQVMVQDDRVEWANTDHYPQATQIFTTSIETTIAQLNHHSALYVALLTRGYQYDVQALKAMMTQAIPYRYIGMMGSRRRVLQVFQAVQAMALDGETEASEPLISQLISQWLQQIYAPIGLDIGALTPEEIAVSIVAEMIAIRRQQFPLQ
ncbi:XdhC family protein [Alkalinema pantanalense CENA528]|uniref:XdhC family protein n=1 Tax=Alkalinema pantanalense TaxID=1620705 RepID=UPI003D6EE3C2